MITEGPKYTKLCKWLTSLNLDNHLTEPEIIVHGCPDKMYDQIQKTFRHCKTLLQCMQILTNLLQMKVIMKPKVH